MARKLVLGYSMPRGLRMTLIACSDLHWLVVVFDQHSAMSKWHKVGLMYITYSCIIRIPDKRPEGKLKIKTC